MQKNIIRWQLIFLFLLSAVVCVFWFYQGSLPDNAYSIKKHSGLNTLTYWASTALQWSAEHTGTWILLYFVIQSLFTTTLAHKRAALLDSIFFLPCSLLLMSASLIFYPPLLGKGLRFYAQNFVQQQLGTSDLALIFVLSLVSTLLIAFRGQVIIALKTLAQKIQLGIAFLIGSVFSLAAVLRSRASEILEKRRKKSKESTQEQQNSALFEPQSPELSAEPLELSHDTQEDESDDEVEDDVPVTAEKKRPKSSLAAQDYKEKEFISCITSPEKRVNTTGPSQEYFEQIISSIEEKLSEFKISGQIINVIKGPVVDTYELELGPGVKVSKVTSITEDLGLALYGAPIRLVYPMKGKTTMGIEVPRNPREIIYLDDVLRSSIFKKAKKRLPIAIGKDSFGDAAVVDLASMPHMLVAGSTGSGKSVFINTLLVSLLVKLRPDEMKLILIDPKQLELALYANLPHLLLPVMTDPKSASLSLLWAVQEMERRYTILKEMGVRNIEGHNRKIEQDEDEIGRIQHLFGDDEESFKLPYIVIIVDEFADLILTKMGKEIETNICRLAAKARAAGIHLVLATQRPSVDVITGLIKSNFPTRVSFRVTSNVDSRTILNTMGAEKLLGMGDMLYKHGIEMTRLHSAFVDEEEIEALMEKLTQFPSSMSESAMEFIEQDGQIEEDGPWSSTPLGGSAHGGSEEDELFQDAVKVVSEQRSASASMLQRRLRIGYNRAANLVEEMEAKGIVGPQQGSKPRQVLLSSESP